MRISKHTLSIILFVSLCFLGFTGYASDTYQSNSSETIDTKISTTFNFKPTSALKHKYDKRILCPIKQILDAYLTKDMDEASFTYFANSKDIVTKAFSVRIVIEFWESTNFSEKAEEFIVKYDIEKIHIGSDYIKGFVPINNIITMAQNASEIRCIRNYAKPSKKSVTSEGFTKVGAAAWHTGGYTGQGIKVAIFDDGFEHINSLITSGDFKAGYTGKDYTGYGFPSYDDHGTECAAIIYDFAPDAEYFLINVDDVSDVKDAKDYCIANGVNIISMSLGWDNYDYGDGKGKLCDIVNDANSHGILWVNCAGNEGCENYWFGNYKDTNSNDWNNFYASDEGNTIHINGGETVFIEMTWDGSLDNCDQDYDLYLFDSYGNQVDYSDNLQDGTFQAYEYIVYTPMYSGDFDIAILNYSANGTSNFRLFVSLDYEMEYRTASHSITVPADAVGAFAVGAIDEYDWFVTPAIIEDFSSKGPTSDNRIKPDICAPDGTSDQYGSGYFYGTSASAPHAAGAAALYWSSNKNLNATLVKNYLQGNAIDCGTYGKDNIFGYGKLDLTSVPLPDDNYEPNDSASYAYDLTCHENTWLDTIDGMGIQADDDWFEISVKQGFTRVKVECTFDNSQGNIDIELLDSNGNTFTPDAGSTLADSTTDNETLECDISTYGTFYIKVYNENKGNEYNLTWETLQVPPTCPSNFVVDKTTSSRVFLKWDLVASADKYVLEQGPSDNGPWQTIYEGIDTSYTDSDLESKTTYWYRIKAVNNNGDSAWSSAISGTTSNKASGGLCGMVATEGNANIVQFFCLITFLISLVFIRVYKQKS